MGAIDADPQQKTHIKIYSPSRTEEIMFLSTKNTTVGYIQK